MPFFSYDNPHLLPFGKWQEEGDTLVSYGTITHLRMAFIGSAVTLSGDCETPISIFLDGQETVAAFSGSFTLFTAPGLHTLTIEVRGDRRFAFRGLTAEQLLSPARRPYIKFIGDSITNAWPGFCGAAARLGQINFSNDSVGGMSLCDGWGWPLDKSPKVGMESYYFRCCRTQFDADYEDYRFAFDSVPDALVVFLGTNDYLDSPEDKAAGHVERFAPRYAAFIEKLAARYPAAHIYIFEPLSDKFCRQEGIEAAFALMKTALGGRVTLLPTNEWGVALSPDGTHPSHEGYTALGVRLANELLLTVSSEG